MGMKGEERRGKLNKKERQSIEVKKLNSGWNSPFLGGNGNHSMCQLG